MDTLEESAMAHCSHLTRSKRDWVVDMVKILKKAEVLPIYQKDRLKLYSEAGIPDRFAKEFDGSALTEALSDFHKGMTGGGSAGK